MAIITFCSNETKETGQTLSLAAIATSMAIEHNYKILIVSTSFNDTSLENCFWEYNKIRNTGAINNENQNIGLQSGIEGLLKVLASNRTSTEIVKNYARTILKDNRLDFLLSPITKNYKEYSEISEQYADVLQIANKFYDMIFVDLSKRMPQKDMSSILQISDIVVMNLTQKQKAIDEFYMLKENNEFYKRRNIMLAIGRYDQFSKYNNKNIMRYLKERNPLCVIPYNTLFFEACSEGTIIDYFLKITNISDETDRNYIFKKEVSQANNNIIFRLQEIRMKM